MLKSKLLLIMTREPLTPLPEIDEEQPRFSLKVSYRCEHKLLYQQYENIFRVEKRWTSAQVREVAI